MSHQSFVKSNGAIPDGYVLTYSVADGYWKPKLASAISGIQKQVEWSLVDRAINNSLSLTNLAGSFTTGIRFQVQNTLTITGVRFRYNATANKTIKISLWDNTQARIASGTVAVTTGTSVYSGYFDVPYTVTSSTQNKTLAVSIWQNDGGSYNAGAADSNQASTPFKAGPFLWYPFAFSNYGTGDAFIASTAGGEVYNYIEPIFGEVLLTTPNASGDLSGVYPNPTVAKIKGNAVATQILGSAHDGYVLKWSNADGYWRAYPNIGWITAYDLDFTTQTTQTFSGNGDVTIDGKTWTVSNFANSRTFEVLNGTGLRIYPNGNTSDYANASQNTAPLLKIPITSIISGYRYSATNLRIWLYGSVSGVNQNFERAAFGVEKTGLHLEWKMINLFAFDNGSGSAYLVPFINNTLPSTTGTVNILAFSTYNVNILTIRSAGSVATEAGIYSSGWPTESSLVHSLNYNETTSQQISDVTLFLTAYNIGGQNNMTFDIKRVKIEYKDS